MSDLDFRNVSDFRLTFDVKSVKTDKKKSQDKLKDVAPSVDAYQCVTCT